MSYELIEIWLEQSERREMELQLGCHKRELYAIAGVEYYERAIWLARDIARLEGELALPEVMF